MQTVSSLTKIKSWLEKLIAAEHLTLKSPTDGEHASSYRLAVPAVHVGYVPPNGVLDPKAKPRIPCLVVGAEQSDDDRDGTVIAVRITAAVYDPGEQTFGQSSQQLQLVPNFDGYITLLNFLDRVKEWMLRSDAIAGRFQLESPVALKTYEEQPWPYWYGTLTFTASGLASPVTGFAEALR